MTVGGYIKSKYDSWNLTYSDDVVGLELAVVDIDSSEEMTPEINLDNFYYRVIPDILLNPSSVSEGGYSVSFDKVAIEKYYSLVAKRLGKPDLLASNAITDITNQW